MQRAHRHLVEYDPVGVDLRVTFGVKDDRLEDAEVGGVDGSVVGADVEGVRVAVVVVVHLACVAASITCDGTTRDDHF